MKYLKGLSEFNMIKEGWQTSLKKELLYDREDDIRLFFINLFDLGWIELPVKHRICGSNFDVDDNRIFYDNNSLYPRYTFILESNKSETSMNNVIELVGDIDEILERIRLEGYVFNVEQMVITPKGRIEISIYHEDDVIPCEMIFIIFKV